MSVQLVKKLCKLQGITIHMRVPVICPRCQNKTMEIDVESGEGYCTTCEKKSDIRELVAVCEEEEMDRHRKFKDISEKNNGVGGNY